MADANHHHKRVMPDYTMLADGPLGVVLQFGYMGATYTVTCRQKGYRQWEAKVSLAIAPTRRFGAHTYERCPKPSTLLEWAFHKIK